MASRRIRRRDFIAGSLASLGAMALQSPLRAARTRRSPNIIVIMTDEHNATVAGCYGNRRARTPHLDRLATRGVTFDACYTNSPLCVPARLAFTAGKYIHRTGAWSNSCWLPSPDYPSLPRVLRSAGYEPFLCGKQHYDRTRRYGFVEIGGNMNRSSKTGRGGRRRADDTRVNARNRDARFSQFHTGERSGVLRHDQAVTAGVLDFLARRKRSDRPFFLFAGYLAPHFPLIVPRPYWAHYRDKIPMPVLPPGHVESQPLNYHHLRRGFGIVQTDPKLVKLGRELYYGLTEWVDNEIGKVLDALAKSPFADDTIVIYTTDHGENMGEHHLWWKNCMYDTAARIPLIVSWPQRWKGGQRRAGACSLVDLVQTIAQLAGTSCPDDWDGDSLVPLLDDPKAPWKDFAISQYYAHNIASGYAMLRMGNFKYVYHSPPDENHPAERELYDLEADPGEFKNLARNPAHAATIAKMHKKLVEELGEHPDETERRCRADYAKGYQRGNKPGKTRKEKK